MEKLQPLLAHKFWVLSGLALVLPTTGWFLGTGTVEQRAEEAETAVETAFSSVPPANSPNPAWPRGLQARNETIAARQTRAHQYLWETQRAARWWPASVNKAAEQHMGTTMEALPPDVEIKYEVLDQYRRIYNRTLIPRLRAIVEPFSTETGLGKVNFPEGTLDPRVPPEAWVELPPTPLEMLQVQEDLWLYESLLNTVADLNAEADTITEAPIKQITTLQLRGGNPEALEAEMSAAAGGQQADDDGGAPARIQFLGVRSAGQAGSGAAIGINLDAVFGPDTAATASAGDDDSDGSYGSNAAVPADDAEYEVYYGRGAGGGDGAAAGGLRRRYVDDRLDEPYKTRGFYLLLVIDHRQLPELMIRLAHQTWPVQILRVQWAEGAGSEGATGPRSRPAPSTSRQRQSFAPNNRLRLPGNVTNRDGVATAVSGQEPSPEALHAAATLQEALSNPNLIQVAIAGKLTIFRSPTSAQSQQGGSLAAAGNGAAPAGAGLSQDPPASADGGSGLGTESTPPDSVEPSSSGEASATNTALPAEAAGNNGSPTGQPSGSNPAPPAGEP